MNKIGDSLPRKLSPKLTLKKQLQKELKKKVLPLNIINKK